MLRTKDVQANAVNDILNERVRQDSKWGEQNHHPFAWMTILGEEYGEACQDALRAQYKLTITSDYRKELIEVAAVALAAVECLDRHNGEFDRGH